MSDCHWWFCRLTLLHRSFSLAEANCFSSISIHLASTTTSPAYIPLTSTTNCSLDINLWSSWRSMSGSSSRWYLNRPSNGGLSWSCCSMSSSMLAFGTSLVEVAFGRCSFPALLARGQCCLDFFDSVLCGPDQCRLFHRMMSTYALSMNEFFAQILSTQQVTSVESSCMFFGWNGSPLTARSFQDIVDRLDSVKDV